jgi:Ca2+-binding EF-hand superfamily protein
MGKKASKQKQPNENDKIDLSEEEINFLLENTSLTKKEITKWHNEFIEQNPNGKQDLEKFSKTLSYLFKDEVLGEGDSRKFGELIFGVFDKDANNYIEFDEFILAICTISDKNWANKLYAAFKICDQDGDGKIDIFELEKIIDAIYDLKNIPDYLKQGENSPKLKSRTIFKKLDRNDDKYITEKEFVDGMLKNVEFIPFVVGHA